MNPVSCNPNTPDDDGKYSPDWVAAARGGDAYYGGEKGAIKIHHSDGWITYYVHLGQTDLLPTSTTSPTPVNEGDHLGHPSCQGNTSGIHLHFAVNYNGQFQSVNGTNLGGWTVVESLYHYNGTMTCPDGRVKTASSARYESSKIVDDCQPSAGSALSVVLIIDSTGSMAVEFALLCPVLVVLLMGIVSYGSWLWLAQSMQGIASEAARASIAGVSDAEREALARAEVAVHTPGLFQVAPSDVVVEVDTDAT